MPDATPWTVIRGYAACIDGTMRTRSVRRLLARLVVGRSAGLLGGIGPRAIPGVRGVVSGCVTTAQVKRHHALPGLDTVRSAIYPAEQRQITWNHKQCNRVCGRCSVPGRVVDCEVSDGNVEGLGQEAGSVNARR
jgi:hypothetical protein